MPFDLNDPSSADPMAGTYPALQDASAQGDQGGGMQDAGFGAVASYVGYQAKGGVVGQILGALSQQFGLRITARSVLSIIGKLGLAGAAAALGLDLPSISIIFMKSKRRRGGRGITGRQLSNAKRVIGVVSRMHRQLASAFPRSSSHAPHSRRPPQFRIMAGGKPRK